MLFPSDVVKTCLFLVTISTCIRTAVTSQHVSIVHYVNIPRVPRLHKINPYTFHDKWNTYMFIYAHYHFEIDRTRMSHPY